MIPEPVRALRTCAVLALLAVPPPLIVGLGMLHQGWWWSGSALAFTTLCLIGIAVRAGSAYDRIRFRRVSPLPVMAFALPMLGLLLGPNHASAQRVETLARAGYWSSFIAAGELGDPICGMDITGPEGQHFLVKRIGENPFLTVHVAKTSWRLPPGAQIGAMMQIGAVSFSGTGTASADGRRIEWTIRGAEIAAFDRAFRAGSTMTIYFRQGNELPWDISLRGSRAVSESFVGCMQAVNRILAQERAPPTQPFAPQSSAPAAPQPRHVTPGAPERRT